MPITPPKLSLPTSLEELPALLTKSEAARFLRITTRTLDAWRGQGRITAYKLSDGCIRFRRSDVLALVGGLSDQGETNRAS